MVKITDYKGEDALDVLADMLEPATEILADKVVSNDIQAGKYIQAVKGAIKKHKKAVIELMAALEREDAEEYAKKVNILTLPANLIALLNDPELISFFTSQVKEGTASFGSVMENTQETEKE